MKMRIVLILAALAVAGAVLYSSYRQSVQQAYLAEYYAVVQELDVERELVEDELNRLEQEKIQQRAAAKAVFLFEDVPEALYTEVFPLLQAYGFTGVAAFSAAQYPGAEDCITPAEWQELQAAGWSACAWWDGSDPEDSFGALQAVFDRLSLPMPEVICVEEYGYTPELDATLSGAGFTTVIHHEEAVELPAEPQLAHLGAVRWNNPLALNLLEETMDKRETLAISVDFSTNFGWFDGELFPNMCAYLQKNENALHMTDLEDVLETAAEREAWFQARADYLRAELERYDKEIAAVYDLYEQYGAELAIPEQTEK